MDDSAALSPIPQLTVVAADSLTPAERDEIIALCTAAFDEDFSQFFSQFPDSTHVLARLHGALVGHASWVTRWLQQEPLPTLRTAYIEAVAVDPAHQGTGVGSTVMRRTALEIERYELGALGTARVSFYERLGWELWRGPLAIRTPEGLLDTPGARVMLLRTPSTPPLNRDSCLSAEWRSGELW